MTAPLSDEALAEIEAGLEGVTPVEPTTKPRIQWVNINEGENGRLSFSQSFDRKSEADDRRIWSSRVACVRIDLAPLVGRFDEDAQ